jgi:hypothetical protein
MNALHCTKLTFVASAAALLLACGDATDTTDTTDTSDQGQGGSTSGSGGATGGGEVGGMGPLGGGGEGGNVLLLCEPGQTRSCYTGPDGTEDVGLCLGGIETCSPDGLAWGPCEAEVTPSVEDCTAQGDEDCDGVACSETLWSTSIGGDAAIQAWDTATDSAGNAVTAITFKQGSITLPNNQIITNASLGNVLVVIKYDPAGNMLWAKHAGTANVLRPKLAIAPNDDILVASSFIGDIDFGGANAQVAGAVGGYTDVFVARFSPGGASVFSKHLTTHSSTLPAAIGPTGNKRVSGIDIDASGNIYLGGMFTGHWGGLCFPSCPTPVPSADVWLRKLGAAGNTLWMKTTGGSGNDMPGRLAVSGQSGVAMVGQFVGITNIGGQIITGTNQDGWLAHFDVDGNLNWIQTVSSPSGIDMTGIVASASRIVIGGDYNFGTPLGANPPLGDSDYFLAEFDLAGNQGWVTTHGAPGAFLSRPSLTEGPSGELIMTGSIAGQATIAGTFHDGGNNDLNRTPLVIKHDAQGNALWARSFQVPTASNRANSAAVAPNGDVLFGGNHREPINFGDQLLPHVAETDVFMVRLQP